MAARRGKRCGAGNSAIRNAKKGKVNQEIPPAVEISSSSRRVKTKSWS